MRLVTFVTQDDSRARIGALGQGGVVDFGLFPTLPYEDMVALLEAGSAGMEAARQAVAEAEEGRAPGALIPADRVVLRAPVPGARKLFALAGNYLEHVRESDKVSAGTDKTPRVFMKPPSTTLRGSGDPIVLHRFARGVDFEAELAVVMGRMAKYVSKDDAVGYVAGYSCFNDVSERKFKVFERQESTEWDRFFDWLNGKWVDSFGPMGPALVTTDEVVDVSNLELSLTVNDVEKQRANTAQMIFDVATIIEFISAFCTLEPGDIIATGTPAGVGATTKTFLKPGDVVEVRISSLGVLSNPVVAEGL